MPKGSKEGIGIGLADKERTKWSDVGSTNCSTLHTGFGVCENDGFHGDIEYFYEVIFELTEVKEGEYMSKTYINIYETAKEDWLKPIKRENLKLIKTIQIKENAKDKSN